MRLYSNSNLCRMDLIHAVLRINDLKVISNMCHPLKYLYSFSDIIHI